MEEPFLDLPALVIRTESSLMPRQQNGTGHTFTPGESSFVSQKNPRSHRSHQQSHPWRSMASAGRDSHSKGASRGPSNSKGRPRRSDPSNTGHFQAHSTHQRVSHFHVPLKENKCLVLNSYLPASRLPLLWNAAHVHDSPDESMKLISKRDSTDKLRFLSVKRGQLGDITSHGRTLFNLKMDELAQERDFQHLLHLCDEDDTPSVVNDDCCSCSSNSDETILSSSPPTWTCSRLERTGSQLSQLSMDDSMGSPINPTTTAAVLPGMSTSSMEPITLSSKLVPNIPSVTPLLVTDVSGKLSMANCQQTSNSPSRGKDERAVNPLCQLWTSTFPIPKSLDDSLLGQALDIIPRKARVSILLCEDWDPSNQMVALISEDSTSIGNAIRIMQNAICAANSSVTDDRLTVVRRRIEALLLDPVDNPKRELKLTHLRSKYSARFHTELISVQYGRRGPSSLVELLGSFTVEFTSNDKTIRPNPSRNDSTPAHKSKLALHHIMYLQHFSPTEVKAIAKSVQEFMNKLFWALGLPQEQAQLNIDMEFSQCLAALSKTNALNQFFEQASDISWTTCDFTKRSLVGWLDDLARNLLCAQFSTKSQSQTPSVKPVIAPIGTPRTKQREQMFFEPTTKHQANPLAACEESSPPCDSTASKPWECAAPKATPTAPTESSSFFTIQPPNASLCTSKYTATLYRENQWAQCFTPATSGAPSDSQPIRFDVSPLLPTSSDA